MVDETPDPNSPSTLLRSESAQVAHFALTGNQEETSKNLGNGEHKRDFIGYFAHTHLASRNLPGAEV
jgi:hypothetical protein